jgi:hypothetical protein
MRTQIKISILIFSIFVLLIGPTRSVKADDSVIVPMDTNDKDGCTVNFNTPQLSLIGNDKYIEAGYKFDNQCNPTLISIKRLDYIPPEVKEEPYSSKQTYTPHFSLEFPFQRGDSSVTSSTNPCHTKTWETDVVYLTLIYAQNDTVYTWDGTRVSYFSVTGSWWQYFSWWYRYDSSVNGDWNPYPTTVKSTVTGSFYCNGGPFCGGGPMYYITLYSKVTVTNNGSCSGQGQYSGTVCRLDGRNCFVYYSVWKD